MFDRLSEGRWWDRAWSLVEGCTPCSPGCERCWLRGIDHRFKKTPAAVTFRAARLALPGRARKPAAWAVWSDLFHPAVPQYQQHEAWKVMRDCPRHRFLVLTKRPAEMLRVLSGKCSAHGMDLAQPLPNVWVGVTVCNQQEADEKIPLLLQTPAAVRFISYEPALGPVDFHSVKTPSGWINSLTGVSQYVSSGQPVLDWVVAGGESGPGARPAHPDWFRSVRDQCQAAGVPFFFKQWGEWAPKKVYQIAHKEHAGQLVKMTVVSSSDRRDIGRVHHWAYPADAHDEFRDIERMTRVGKQAAGRLLDGHPYSATPISSPHRCPKCGNVGATACWCRRCNWRSSWMLEPARAH